MPLPEVVVEVVEELVLILEVVVTQVVVPLVPEVVLGEPVVPVEAVLLDILVVMVDQVVVVDLDILAPHLLFLSPVRLVAEAVEEEAAVAVAAAPAPVEVVVVPVTLDIPVVPVILVQVREQVPLEHPVCHTLSQSLLVHHIPSQSDLVDLLQYLGTLNKYH